MSGGRRDKRRSITQRYLTYPFHGHNIRLPLLYIRLKNSETEMSFKTTGLVDSGATLTFIPTEFAELLELKNLGKEEADGAGGSFETYITSATIEVLKGSRVVIKMEITDAMVPKDPEAIPYVILGRDFLFNEYDITFRETKMKTILRPNKR